MKSPTRDVCVLFGREKQEGACRGFRHFIGQTARIRPHNISENGRPIITFSLSNKSFNFKVCRLVLLAFVGPCPEGMECRHLDGNPANNRIGNLVWGTKKENIADKKRHGTHVQGSKQNGAKLKERDVRRICRLLAQGEGPTEISRKFGVHQVTITDIKLGRSWGWLTKQRKRRA